MVNLDGEEDIKGLDTTMPLLLRVLPDRERQAELPKLGPLPGRLAVSDRLAEEEKLPEEEAEMMEEGSGGSWCIFRLSIMVALSTFLQPKHLHIEEHGILACKLNNILKLKFLTKHFESNPIINKTNTLSL